ncbi:MAG: YncE family protein, partial [Nitrosotalea sp.]
MAINRNYAYSWLIFSLIPMLLFSVGILVHNAYADTITTTISLGNQVPSSIDINPSTDKIYASSWVYSSSTTSCYGSNNKVLVIDGTSNSVMGNVTVGSSPAGVGTNLKTNMIYVANFYGGVSVINGTTNT